MLNARFFLEGYNKSPTCPQGRFFPEQKKLPISKLLHKILEKSLLKSLAAIAQEAIAGLASDSNHGLTQALENAQGIIARTHARTVEAAAAEADAGADAPTGASKRKNEGAAAAALNVKKKLRPPARVSKSLVLLPAPVIESLHTAEWLDIIKHQYQKNINLFLKKR